MATLREPNRSSEATSRLFRALPTSSLPSVWGHGQADHETDWLQSFPLIYTTHRKLPFDH